MTPSYTRLRQLAERAIEGNKALGLTTHTVNLSPEVVIGLLDEINRLRAKIEWLGGKWE